MSALAHQRVLRILASPWQARLNRGHATLWWAGLGMCAAAVLGPLAAFVSGVAGAGALLMAALVATVLAGVVWMQLGFNLLLQNDPQLARLVPGHRSSLRRAASAAGLVALMLAGGLVAWAGHALDRPTSLLVAGGALVLALLTAALRQHLLAFAAPPMILATLFWNASRHAPDWPAIATRIGPWTLPLALGLAWWLVRAQILGGSPRHRRQQQRLHGMTRDLSDLAVGLGRPEHGNSVPARKRQGLWLIHRWLGQLLARPNASVSARLALGLGPGLHWSSHLSSLLGIGLAGLGALGLHLAWPDSGTLRTMAMVVPLSVAMLPACAPMLAPPLLHRGRRDQALLRLLPGAPQKAALNRWLLLRLAITQVGLCLMASALLVLMQALRGLGSSAGWTGEVHMALACCWLSTLSWAAWVRDWSRFNATGGLRPWLAALTIAMPLLAAFAWVELLHASLPTLALWVIALNALTGLWAWRRLGHWPAALPVGRND